MTMAGLSEGADLLVAGCGIAGLSAAVSALQSGLSATLADRSGALRPRCPDGADGGAGGRGGTHRVPGRTGPGTRPASGST